MATITSTSTRITISGTYKEFTSDTGSTSTVIQYSIGDAPASGDAGRFLMWKNGSVTGDWEIRFIESATSTSVTITDGGFSSAPAIGDSFVISTNLEDINTATSNSVMRKQGRSYQMRGRDFELTLNAFLADVNCSLVTSATQTGSGFIRTYPLANNCALQFGRLIGGDANDSTETIGGCQIIFEAANDTLIFTNKGSANSAGPILNFYGCLLESFNNSFDMFIRSSGAMRLIGCICDGPMGGRLYNSASELVSTRFSGNTNGGIAWSLGGVFTRPIDDAFFFQGNTAVKAFQNFTGIFTNITFADSITNIIDSSGANSGLLFTFIDCTTFTDSKITNTKGNYKQAKSINYKLTDTSGSALTGAKVAIYDNTGIIQDSIKTSSVSGLVDSINAVFFDRTHGNTSINKAPFDIRIRKYGYQYQDFQSAISEPIKQEFRLPSNTVTVLSEASAGALTFITINFTLKTVTVEQEYTLSEIYDYCQAQLALDANIDESEFLTSSDGNVFTFADDWDLILNTNGKIGSATGKTVVFGGTGLLQMLDSQNMIDNLTVSGDVDLNALATPITGVVANTIDFDTVGTYTLDGCTISEVTNSSGGAITLNLTNDTDITTNTGPNITLEQSVNITALNIIDGSRVQVYNVTKSSEIDNSVVSGSSGYSKSVNLLSASVDDGDTIRLRATYTSGTSAKSEALATGIIGITGLSFLTTQDEDTAYNTLSLDGSTITKFTADYVNDEVDISVASDFTLAEFYAWWSYNLTTSQGIAEFFGGVTSVDEANFKINNSVVNIYLDNATATNISQTDNRRLYRADGARPVVSSTSGGGGIDVEWRSPVSLANSDTIDSNISAIKTQTDKMQFNVSNEIAAQDSSTIVTDIETLQTTVDNLNNPSAAEIATEILDNNNTV
jgi:hypothetical protein